MAIRPGIIVAIAMPRVSVIRQSSWNITWCIGISKELYDFVVAGQRVQGVTIENRLRGQIYVTEFLPAIGPQGVMGVIPQIGIVVSITTNSVGVWIAGIGCNPIELGQVC